MICCSVRMRTFLLLSLSLLGAAQAGRASEAIEIGQFSKAKPGGELPSGWRRYALRTSSPPTAYSLVELDGRVALQADADASASAILHPLHADPRHTPWLTWSWQVENVLRKGDILTKEGDDYPARVYVVFDYDLNKLPFGERTKIRMARMVYGESVPVATLCYVWDNKQPVGFSTWSAYTNRLRMVVAESGSQRLKQWVSVRRNVAEDFQQAFGEPPPPISAVIIASDTDNTGERVRAWFGDLSLGGGPSQPK